MKKTCLSIIMLAALLYCNCAYTQYVNPEPNGIHVSGGQSSQTLNSSNIGFNCEATGSKSFAGGSASIATGGCAFAFGNACQANQTNAYVMGNKAMAMGSNNLALGFFIESRQNGAIIIGSGENTYTPLITTVQGITMGMGSSKPTLFISKALGTRTGKIGIGNTFAPQAKLHIVADYNEDASIFLQPTNLEKQTSYIKLTDDNHKLLVSEDGCMHLLSLNKNFRLSSRNASITNGEFSLGSTSDRKINIMTTSFPAFYANAYRTGNSYICYQHGASYAIEFNNNAMLFRTAYTENNSRIMEINGWRDPLCLKTNGSIVMNGKVGINRENTTNGFALAVDGGIISTEVYVMTVENWPDFVFSKEYELMSLSDLKQYINTNHHLPDLPSEQEVKENGFEVSDMQAQLLQKIEELTLYILQQEERISQLELELKKNR